MTRHRASRWLLPLLAVVLNFGGGPVAWAVPAQSHQAPPASAVSAMEHCSGAQEAEDPGPADSSHHGKASGCCASGACYCGCPAPFVLAFSGVRVSYGLADAPVRPAENLLPTPYQGRLLRPPIA